MPHVRIAAIRSGSEGFGSMKSIGYGVTDNLPFRCPRCGTMTHVIRCEDGRYMIAKHNGYKDKNGEMVYRCNRAIGHVRLSEEVARMGSLPPYMRYDG